MSVKVNPGRIIPSMPWNLQFFSGLAGTSRVIAPQDGDRAGIAFIFQPPIGVVLNHEWRIYPGGTPPTDQGWVLNASNPRLLFRFADFGPLVSQEWQGRIVASGPGTIYSLGVYTFRFQPRIR